MTRPKEIAAVLDGAAAVIQGGMNLIEHLKPTKVSGAACGQVIETLSVSLSECLSGDRCQ